MENGQKFGCFYLCNAILSGLIAVSSCLEEISVNSGIIIAVVAGFLYFLISKVYLKLEIDDPQESSIIYGWMGLYSSIIVGFVDRDNGLIKAQKFTQLGIHFAGVISIVAISALLTFLLAAILKVHRRIRFGHIYEVVGLNNLI